MRAQGAPIVVKADGLAAGKGVVVAMTIAEAEAAIDMMFDGGLGDAGAQVVIEEFLTGEEASFFVLSDGEHALAARQRAGSQARVRRRHRSEHRRHGRLFAGAGDDAGSLCARTMNEIVVPTIRAMKAMGCPYQGVLFAGLMITAQGPKLIEYNVRFGDPECQVLMLRLQSDLVPALIATCDRMLGSFDLRWFPDPALTVVMAAKGYPGDYPRGSVIAGLDDAGKIEGVEIFHAGTKADGARILANGGRVLNVSAIGKTVGEAQARAYAAVDKIKWPEGFCRRDIGHLAVAREKIQQRLTDPAAALSDTARKHASRRNSHARSRRPVSRFCHALDRHVGRKDFRARRRQGTAAAGAAWLSADARDVAPRCAGAGGAFHPDFG